MTDDEFSTPIHPSLNRPMLMWGGERTLMMLLAVVSGVFIISLAQIWAAIVGFTLWAVGSWALIRAARFDPQLSNTGRRALTYRRHYAARATPFARQREVK